MTFTAEQLYRYQQMLESERDRLRASLASLRDGLITSGVSDPEGDVPSDVSAAATALEVHDRVATIAEHDARILTDVEAALRRISDGTYGMCVVSGRQIPTDRLDALPWADRCVEYAGSPGA